MWWEYCRNWIGPLRSILLVLLACLKGHICDACRQYVRRLSVRCHISKTKQDRSIVTKVSYTFGTAHAVAAFRSSSDARSCGGGDRLLFWKVRLWASFLSQWRYSFFLYFYNCRPKYAGCDPGMNIPQSSSYSIGCMVQAWIYIRCRTWQLGKLRTWWVCGKTRCSTSASSTRHKPPIRWMHSSGGLLPRDLHF